MLSGISNTFAQDKIDFTDIESDEFLMFSDKDRTLFEDAISQIKDYEYIHAMPILEGLHTRYPDHIYVKYLLAICQMYDSKKEETALVNLRSLEEHRDKLHYFNFVYAKCLEKNGKYSEAINEFELFLSESKDPVLNASAAKYISYCKNESLQKSDTVQIKIKNIGNLTNTENSEYAPAIPADASFMIYTYRGLQSVGGKQSAPGIKSEKGRYFEDVFIVYKNDSGIWSSPHPIKEINTTGHDACVSISSDGQKIFLYRNTGATNGDIYESNLKGERWSEPVKVNGINSKYWEGSACISPFGKTIIFSSERPGGIGGKDLYRADLDAKGQWTNIKNLGPVINTKDDEDAPFITPDFKYLYFSSSGHESIGGYDIFRSDIINNEFNKPYHLEKPLNSIHDEIYYVVTADGKQGYYSSDKKNGFGQQDIYLVEPGIYGELPVLALIKGKIYADTKPVKANITIENAAKNIVIGSFVSNSISGKYMLPLAANAKYKIIYSAPGFKNKIEFVDASNLGAFMEMDHEVNFEPGGDEKIEWKNSIQYEIEKKFPKQKLAEEEVVVQEEKKNVIEEEKIVDVIKEEIPVPLTETCDCDKFIGKDLNDINVYTEFLKSCGNSKQNGLIFKIQIGAYRHPEKFKYENLKDIAEADVKKYEDGITRFTLLEFNTLDDAEKIRQQCIAKGTKDAWVVAFYKGKRTMLEDLIKMNFFRPKNS